MDQVLKVWVPPCVPFCTEHGPSCNGHARALPLEEIKRRWPALLPAGPPRKPPVRPLAPPRPDDDGKP